MDGYDGDTISDQEWDAADAEKLDEVFRPVQNEPFKYGTGLMGSTEPGQLVTPVNVGDLPVGSVVRIADGSRLIHLHDDLWLWCMNDAWCYDRIENLAWRLGDRAFACHVAPKGTANGNV